MHYFITGRNGFIGRNLTDYLQTSSLPYSVIESSTPSRDSVVIHLSASTNVRESITNPIKCHERNSSYTLSLLNILSSIGVKKFIFTSSLSASKALSPYLASKLSCEAYCKAYKHSYNIDTCIARLSNVYGPCSEFKSSIIPTFIKSTILKTPFYLYGNGNQTRDFIFVKDAVKILSASLMDVEEVNICSGVRTSINSLIDMLTNLSQEFFNYSPEIHYLPPNQFEVCDSQELKGIDNPTDLLIGLRKTYQWFYDNLEILNRSLKF